MRLCEAFEVKKEPKTRASNTRGSSSEGSGPKKLQQAPFTREPTPPQPQAGA